MGAGLLLRGVGVVVGEDLKRLAMLCHQTSSNIADTLANLLGGHDPQIATRKLLHKHRGTGGIATGLELTRERDDVAVADAADLDDLHTISIYADSRNATQHEIEVGIRSSPLDPR